MSPITFAHRGARRDEPENTLPAFVRGRELGASGLESDVWLAADGVPVLVHDAVVRRGLRRIRIGAETASDLAAYGIPSLAALYGTCGVDYELSLDLKDPHAADAVLAVARDAGALHRLWLCHPDTGLLADLRRRSPEVRLVHSDRKDRIGPAYERHAYDLATAGIDAMNLHHTEWTKGFMALFHRFGVRTFAWDVQEVRHLRAMLGMGADALYSDAVARLVGVVAEFATVPAQNGTDASDEPA